MYDLLADASLEQPKVLPFALPTDDAKLYLFDPGLRTVDLVKSDFFP